MNRLLIQLIMILLASAASASPAPWSGMGERLPVEGYTQSWPDTGGNAGVDDVRALPDEAWQQEHPPAISHGYVSEPYWFRTRIRNTSDVPRNPYLEIGYPALHHINLHVFSNGERVKQVRTGNRRPFDQRPVEHRNFVVPLELAPGEHSPS